MSRLASLLSVGGRSIGVAHRRRVSHSFATHRTLLNEPSARSRVSVWRKLWTAYCTALEKRPLLTKASMACVIFFSSDSVTQYILARNSEAENNHIQRLNPHEASTEFRWNATRAMSAGCFGVASTTFLHFWWGFLERAVAARIPLATNRLTNTAIKVLMHQSMGAPFYIYSYYVVTNLGQRLCQLPSRTGSSTTSTSLDRGQAIPQAWKEVNEKAAHMFWPTMMRHWSVWPWVQSFNFYFTPLHHRVLVHNTVLIVWSGYLSYLNHNHTLGKATASTSAIGEDEASEDGRIPHLGSKSAVRAPMITTLHSDPPCTATADSSDSLKSR